MSDFFVRKSIESTEEYIVQNVKASLVLNSNESNYPLPDEISAALAARVASFPFNRYPPVRAELLARTIAKELDLGEDNVKIGNGSTELLARACYVFGGQGKRIALPWPCAELYGECVRLSDSEIVHYPMKAGVLDADRTVAYCQEQQPSLLVICNPHNLFGTYAPLPVIEDIISRVECPVLIDESYMEFAGGRDLPPGDMRPLDKLWLVAGSALSLVGRYRNLIVLRSFSAAYGLAGLRCGYGVGSSTLMCQMAKALLPYPVNAFTLVVAKTVYDNKALYKERIKTICEERARLTAFFEKMGFFVYPSAANFITVRAEEPLQKKMASAYAARYMGGMPQLMASGMHLFGELLKNGILVCCLADRLELEGCVRISVGLPEENKQLMAKVTELCLE